MDIWRVADLIKEITGILENLIELEVMKSKETSNPVPNTVLRVPHFYCKYFTNGQKNTHIENWCKYWTTENNTNKVMVAHFRWKLPYFGGEYRWFSYFLVVFIDLILTSSTSGDVWIPVGTPHWPRPSRNCPGGGTVSCRDSHPILVRNPYRLPTNTLGVGGIYPRTPQKKHTNFKTPNFLED